MSASAQPSPIRRIALLLVCGSISAWPLLAANSQQGTTRDFQKTLQLGLNQTVSIEHRFGEIRLHGENGRDVHIGATIHTQANTQEEAEKFAEQIRIEVEQDASGIKVRTVYPDEHTWYVRIGKKPSYSVDYDIAVPGDAKLWIKNGFGNVDIRGVGGWAEVENGHGELAFRDGGSMKLTNSLKAWRAKLEEPPASGNITVASA